MTKSKFEVVKPVQMILLHDLTQARFLGRHILVKGISLHAVYMHFCLLHYV